MSQYQSFIPDGDGPGARALPALCGLTEAETALALRTVQEARGEFVQLGQILDSLESIIRRFDDPSGAPAGAVMDILAEYRGLLETGIALRAFSSGKRYQGETTT